MLDFTSALFLGLLHSSTSLRSWSRLTTGVPAALAPPDGADGVAKSIAALAGTEEATLFPSTLHLFSDLFDLCSPHRSAIWVDAGVYPVAAWGIQRSAAHGVPVRTFAHHSAESLRASTLRGLRGARSPVVVTDGVCQGCGQAAPLRDYVEIAAARGGIVVVDDTQALGILGEAPGPRAPWGAGGGGSLRYWGLSGQGVLLASSLAKAFGVPLATLAGPADLVRRVEAASATRVHSSPPCAAVIHVAESALFENLRRGDMLRSRLLGNVRRLRARLSSAGLGSRNALFPVQTVDTIHSVPAVVLHERLLRQRVRTVLMKPRCAGNTRVSLFITASHTSAQIDQAVDAISGAIGSDGLDGYILSKGAMPCGVR